MAINVPTHHNHLAGDLARAKTIEADDSWPTIIEIVAYWSKDGSRNGKRRSIAISADEYFGRNGYNAPMTGEALQAKIDQLRRQK